MSSAPPPNAQPVASASTFAPIAPQRRGVLKVGGATLFSEASWPRWIETFQQNVDQLFILVGGGDTVESMRRAWDLYPGLDPVAMHWRCVQLLDATWEIACELLPSATPIPDWPALQCAIASCRPDLYLVRATAFYDREANPAIPNHWLPRHGWETTTDALGWLLAKLTGAQRLWLIKQCECQGIESLQWASQQGIIDSELARLASQADDSESVQVLITKC